MSLKYFVDCETPRQMSTWIILENTFLYAVNYCPRLKISQRFYNIFLGFTKSDRGVISSGLKAAVMFSLGLTWKEPSKVSPLLRFHGDGDGH